MINLVYLVIKVPFPMSYWDFLMYNVVHKLTEDWIVIMNFDADDN